MTPGTESDRERRDSSAERLAHAAGRSAAATLTSRLLGLIREQVLAALFGAGDQMDAFLVAFRIPNLVRDLFAEGAMSAAFVPAFTTRLAREGKQGAWRLGCNVVSALLIMTGSVVVLGWIFATPLVALYAGQFASVPGKLELTTLLARVMMPFLTLAAIAAASMGMLNSLQHFFLPALAPATFNIVAIVFAIALSPLMPALGLPPILSVAIAVTVGGLTQVAIQWPALVREGFRYRFRVDVTDPGLRHVLVLMGPGTVGLAATQLNLFVSTLLAAREGTGAVSWLQYAFRVMYLPLGLFGVSIATAVLPSASRHVAVRDLSAAREIVRRGLSLMLVVSIPAACGLLVLSTDIVRLLFERGRFTPQDTLATAAALRLYAVGLVGFAATRILSPVFYALGHNRVPVALSIVSVTVNLVMSLLLVRAMGFTGLALATSLAAIVNATSCIVLLRRRLDGIGGRALGVSTLKVAAASAVMLVSVSAVRAGMSGLVSEGGVLVQALALTATIGIGLAALALASRVLGIEEITALARKVRGGGGALLDR